MIHKIACCCIIASAFGSVTAGSSNGRTPAFEAVDHGSSPCPATTFELYFLFQFALQ